MAITWLAALVPAQAKAAIHNLGTYGQTYAISEPDALKEIKDRAARVDWSKVFNRDVEKEKIKNFRPAGLVSLPRAQTGRAFMVELTYTLPFDIPDGRGGILYPKGYTINPLDHINYPKTLVIIDGDDSEQVAWFKNSKYYDAVDTTLILSGGSYYELAKQFNRPVFYLTGDVAERLELEAVPSVVRQKGRYLEVREIVVGKKKKMAKQ